MMDGSSHDQISFLFGDNLSNSDKNMSPFLFADDSGPGTGSEDGGDLPDEPVRSVQQRSGSKRSRAAEVHNLSEKRRRSRINEKMKALQNLIPNSNKTDKASMLDEAIEYLKQLQLQVQMLSMRNGLTSLPMYLPGGLQPLQAPQLCMSFGDSTTAMNMGTLGMLPLNQDPSAHNSFDPTTHCASSHQTVLLATANISAPEPSFPLEPSQPHIRSFQLRVPDEEIFTEGMGFQKQLESGKTKGSISENVVKTVNVASSFQFRRQASSSSLEHNDPLESALPKDLRDGIFSHQFDGLQPEGSFTKDDVKSVKLDI